MKRRRKARGATKHEGATLLKRRHKSGGTYWAVRYRDPRDGKRHERTVPAHLTTNEQRRAWAAGFVRDELAGLVAAVQRSGAPRKPEATLAEAIEDYYRQPPDPLRATTVATYRMGTDALLAFAVERRIVRAADLRPEHLADFRGWMFAAPKMVQAAVKGRRGARVPAKDRTPRSVVSVNSRIRSVKTVLNELRRRRFTPLIARDDLIDNLRRAEEPRPLPQPLKPSDVEGLLQAALRHDAETFAETREEHAGRAERGATPRYEPIAPYVAVLLLTGMREGEARPLAWSAVDLDHGPGGCGSIALDPSAVKTKQARVIDLAVSPLLRQLLRTMKLRAGGARYVFAARTGDDEDARPYSRSLVEAARKRLRSVYGAPDFTWQQLRETCSAYLTNATIFPTATRCAQQLGHSVVVAERHYIGRAPVPVDPAARSLEAAMCVEAEMARVVAALGGTVESTAREVARA